MDRSAGALIKAWVRGTFFIPLRRLVRLPRGQCFVECSLVVAVVPLLFFETPCFQHNCKDAKAGMFSDIYSNLSTTRRGGGECGGGGAAKTFLL